MNTRLNVQYIRCAVSAVRGAAEPFPRRPGFMYRPRRIMPDWAAQSRMQILVDFSNRRVTALEMVELHYFYRLKLLFPTR